MWLRKLLGGLFGEMIEPIVIRCDKQSRIYISENPVFHDKLKHIEMKYHFTQDMVRKGIVKLLCIATDEKIEDVITKLLSVMKFKHF